MASWRKEVHINSMIFDDISMQKAYTGQPTHAASEPCNSCWAVCSSYKLQLTGSPIYNERVTSNTK